MKKIYLYTTIVLLAISLQSCIVSTNAKSDYINYSDNNKNAQIVKVNVPMFIAKPFIKKALREDGESEELISLIKKVKRVKVLTIANPSTEIKNNFKSNLTNSNFSEWMTIKHDGQNVNINVQEKDQLIKKIVLVVNNNSELVMVDVKTKLDTNQLNKLLSNYNQ